MTAIVMLLTENHQAKLIVYSVCVFVWVRMCVCACG